jgi:hypothetical protein
VPHEQRHIAKIAFKVADAARQRRLRNGQPFRRPLEIQFLGDGDEIGQLPEDREFVSGFHEASQTCGNAGRQ